MGNRTPASYAAAASRYIAEFLCNACDDESPPEALAGQLELASANLERALGHFRGRPEWAEESAFCANLLTAIRKGDTQAGSAIRAMAGEGRGQAALQAFCAAVWKSKAKSGKDQYRAGVEAIASRDSSGDEGIMERLLALWGSDAAYYIEAAREWSQPEPALS